MTPDEREVFARAQVWEAVRLFSDAEREHVQQLLLASRSAAPRMDAIQIPLALTHDSRAVATEHDNQADNDSAVPPAATPPRITQWSPSDFVHALLGHLHHVTAHAQQQQQQAPAISTDRLATTPVPTQDAASPSADASSSSSSRRAAKATRTGNRAFALMSDDFPSLVSSAPPPAQAAAASTSGGIAPPKAQTKATKRRITTTLVSEQSAITRPVQTSVSFPPLGGASDASAQRSHPNPWAKRELLERRMMASAEPETATPEPPALSPVLTKTRAPLAHDKAAETRDSSAAKKPALLFDDSPPGGPKRVQPFPVRAASDHVAAVASAVDAGCQSPVITTPVKSASAQLPPPVLLCVKPKRPRRQSLLPSATPDNATTAAELSGPIASQDAAALPRKTADDFAVNTQAAKLYAFLITKRLVGSTCTELQLLIGLLYRTSCTDASPSSCACAAPSEFCWHRHCVQFAATVFDAIEPVLASLGPELLSLLLSSLSDAAICVELQARLQETAQRREELRVAESARIGCRLPVETKASAVRDFALPFCEEVDSRLHYRSPTESVMYANRERVRDGFLDLLRQFQRQQHSLVGIENANVAAAAIASANTLLADVAPENRWWFAKFFVLELIQVGANPFGESDKDLVLTIMTDKLVVKNPDRLRKLHRRFSSQKQQPSQKAASTSASHAQRSSSQSSGNKSHHHHSSASKGASGSSKTERHDASADAKAASAITATFETSREYFAEHQQFFFHFLHSCDSYAFSQLVKYQLEAQFHVLWRASNSSAGKSSSDPRKAFTDVVLKLKVVAKFLGYLRFSPHWHNSAALQLEVAQQNPAFQAAKREAVATLESAESVGLDVKRLLEQSVETATLSKCVPWLCDYLTMLSLDKLSLATTYFQQLLVLLARIYHAPRLDALGETGLYIALQIERVCHVLDVDIAGFLDDPQLRAPQLQPRASVLLALSSDAVVAASPLATGRAVGEDMLPFLHSQVFVQSCVSELEDLRGFLQTRAQPSHRVTKRGDSDAAAAASRSASSRQAIPIRKLRPLQVVTEDDHASSELYGQSDAATSASPPSSSSASVASMSAAASVPDDDRLADAIFKVHPALRKVVEFVVEVVATNICEHVVQHVVAPRADAFVCACASESKLRALAASPSAAPSELEAATILFLQLLENRTARTIHESASASLETAHALCDARVRAAMPPLLPPACHATLAASVTLVALARTRAVVKTLVPTTARSEFLKRTSVQKKAVLKETAPPKTSAPAGAGPTAAGTELSVVRTLSTMFDAHAGVDDDASRDEELVLALKQTSAQVWQLSRTSRAAWQLDDWAALHASLARHVRSFTNRLRELLQQHDRDSDSDGESVDRERPSKAMGPEDEHRHAHKLHALPVWDAMWRVLRACLHVLAQLPRSVVAWTDACAKRKHPPVSCAAVRPLEKTVNRFVDHVVALVELVWTTGAHSRDGNDAAASRRVAKLCGVVRECVEASGAGSEVLLDADELLQRLVLAPRMRVLGAVAVLEHEASPEQEEADKRSANQTLEHASWRHRRDCGAVY